MEQLSVKYSDDQVRQLLAFKHKPLTRAQSLKASLAELEKVQEHALKDSKAGKTYFNNHFPANYMCAVDLKRCPDRFRDPLTNALIPDPVICMRHQEAVLDHIESMFDVSIKTYTPRTYIHICLYIFPPRVSLIS